jgi:uncharacterized protein YndB with AHSA1/START domain
VFWMIPGPKKSAEVVIDAPMRRVWEVVTDSSNFSSLIQGAWWWGPFDRTTAGPGTSFKKGHLFHSPREWDYYIVHWEPLRRFSMGGSPKRWVFDFQLFEHDNGKTRLRCTRRFNVFGWLPPTIHLVAHTAKTASYMAERH